MDSTSGEVALITSLYIKIYSTALKNGVRNCVCLICGGQLSHSSFRWTTLSTRTATRNLARKEQNIC